MQISPDWTGPHLIMLMADSARYSSSLRSLHVENFVHHGKAFAGLKIWNRFKVFSHFLLPFQIDRVAVELSPSRIKIMDLHDKEQILPSSKDRILRYPDFL